MVWLALATALADDPPSIVQAWPPGDDLAVSVAIGAEPGTVEIHVPLAAPAEGEPAVWLLPIAPGATLEVVSESWHDTLSLFEPWAGVGPTEDTCVDRSNPIIDYWPHPTWEELTLPPIDGLSNAPYEVEVVSVPSVAALRDALAAMGAAVPSHVDALGPYLPDYDVAVLSLGDGFRIEERQPVRVRWAGDVAEVPVDVLLAQSPVAYDTLDLAVAADGPVVHGLSVSPNPVVLPGLGGLAADTWLSSVSEALDEPVFFPAETWSAPYTCYYEGYRGTDLSAVREATTPTEAIYAARGIVPTSWVLFAALERHVPPPEGVEPNDFFQFVASIRLPDDYTFDPDALADEIEERMLMACHRTLQPLHAFGGLTRFRSTLGAGAVERVSVSADGVGPVVQSLYGELHHDCDYGESDTTLAQRSLLLPGDVVVGLPPEAELAEQGLTDADYLAPLTVHPYLRLERTGPGAEVVEDHTAWFEEALLDYPVVLAQPQTFEPEPYVSQAKGCQTMPRGAAGLVGLVGLLGLRRRR